MAKAKQKKILQHEDGRWEGVYKNPLFQSEFLDWASYRNDSPIILNTYTGPQGGTVPSRALGQSMGHACPDPECGDNLTWNSGGPMTNWHNGKPFGSVYSVRCDKCSKSYMMPHKYIFRVLRDMGLLEAVEIKEDVEVPEDENEGTVDHPSESNDNCELRSTREAGMEVPVTVKVDPLAIGEADEVNDEVVVKTEGSVAKKRGRPPKSRA